MLYKSVEEINNNLLEKINKKYKDYQIDKAKLILLLKQTIFDIASKHINDTIADDILIMQELDKKVCLYLKDEINKNNIDAEIVICTKYKYIFNRINIELTELEKEELLTDAIKEYDGIDYFSKHAFSFIKQRLELKKVQKTININKLKKFLNNVKMSEDYIYSSLDVLYNYYYDIEDIIYSEISAEEKIIILLKFGYIDYKFYNDKTISRLFGFDIHKIKRVYQDNLTKLREEYYKSEFSKQYQK